MELVLGSVAGALIAMAGTLLIARRQSSGSVKFSQAEDLWAAMREFAVQLQGELADVRKELGAAREAERKCEHELGELKMRIRRLENGSSH